MQRQTFLTRWADRIIEAGWLLALVFTPYFFNLLTARHFEPDKAMVLRAIVLVMLAAWGVKTIEQISMVNERPTWRAWWRAPLAIPALLFGGVFVLATLASVQPGISWWGSYQRGQGTYTNLSYMALFALIVGNLRSREQLQRVLTTVILTGVSVSAYGIVQHYGLDPLPWKGNVITRISSTMGNSIFVAAYLIMVVPWVLYRLTLAMARYRSAPQGERATDWTWLGFMSLLILGQQALFLGILKFMSGVRPVNGDFRYWWVPPVAIALVGGTFALVNAAHTIQPSKKLMGTLLAGFGLWTLLLLLTYTASANSQTVDTDNPLLRDWWLWVVLGVVAIIGFLIASFFLPRRTEPHTRTFVLGQIIGNGAALLLIVMAIFFSQSRGPWIGGMVGIGLFVLLLLLRLIWTGQREGWSSLGRLRAALWATIALGVLAAGLLITFNLSDAPIFERLRNVQYIGRLGRLLETDDGTGRVRTLIWFGDERGGGAVGLLQSNWLRTLTFGHGPETMFTAFNPFYPPELARYEARGASPDRSHQAWLDELATKGMLGLLSYFFLFGSAIWLAWKQMRSATELRFQVLAIAALATIAAHFFEVLVGIPIVSTLTMLWTTFGVLVVGGLLAGLYTIDGRPVSAEAAAAEPSEAAAPEAPERAKARGRAASQPRGRRAAASGRPVTTTVAARGVGFRWTYPLLLIGALMLGWFWNLRNNYADMFLNQAQSFTPRGLQDEAFGYLKLLRAVENDPGEDYYYLQLGSSLLKMAYPYKLSAQQTFDGSTAPRSNQRMQDLFASSADENQRVVELLQKNSTEQLLRYAELVLERAFEINPGNKDHPANLGRLHSLWARRVNGGQEHFQQAIEWFTVAHRIAPNDAVILNELATNLALAGDTDQAESRFKESIALDPRYAETYARLGELYRANGRTAEATQQFVEAVKRNRTILETDTRQLGPLLDTLERDPQSIAALRAAFEEQKQRYDQQIQQAQAEGRTIAPDTRFLSQLGRVRAAAGDAEGTREIFDQMVQSDPQNVTYRQQYTVALSDTQQFDAALEQAEQGLALAQQQQLSREAEDLQRLLDMMRTKAGG
ncbi:MAG TPA: tetratricopeptide repeat protein [Herpetosiphonaceae bacterium]